MSIWDIITGYFRKQKKDHFPKALAFTLKWEGGYSNHPNDSGGATNKGVIQRVYNSYRRLNNLSIQDVRLITDKEVHAIYREMYWNTVCGDKFPEKLATAVFDWGVNSGPNRAIKKLQDCLGVKVDGIVGPVTVEAATDGILGEYLDSREKFYYAIGTGTQKVFLKGWLNRLNDLRDFLKRR